MESFGEYLKGLREERGKPLKEIADNTKIALSNLQFLEQDRYDLLPPRVFVKGFIRSYVEQLGIDPEEVVEQFDAFTKEGEVPDYDQEEHPLFRQNEHAASFISRPWFTIALTAAGLASLAILLFAGVSRLLWWEGDYSAPPPTVRTEAPTGDYPDTTRARSNRGTPERGTAQPETAVVGKLTLEIRALSNTWIRIQPDSGPGEEIMMAPGDVQVFTADKGFQLQTGNAGGIRLRFDGRRLPPLGKPNQTLSLSLP